MHLVVFEGIKWHTFAPLALSRPVFALGSGAGTLLDKQVRHANPARLTLWVRPALADWCRRFVAPRFNFPVAINEPLDNEPAMLVSGRTLHFEAAQRSSDPCVVVDEQEGADGPLVRRAIVHMPGLSPADALNRTERWRSILDLPRAAEQARMAEFVWDLISWNEESLVEDFVALSELRPTTALAAGPCHVVSPGNLWLGREVRVEPGVVLDASSGPIMLDDGCTVGANSVLRGPCYLGARTIVRALTVISGGTSIGAGCRVGGEIHNSIILNATNKWHEGYLGDSYVGHLANLGAGTTTSNVRNTYSFVKLRIGSREFDTGRRYMGALIGDHAKTAIGTRLMTGSYIGYASMIAASRIPPTFVPSFRFITDKGDQEYRIDKALEVMKTVAGLRNVAWNDQDETLVRYAAVAAAEAEA